MSEASRKRRKLKRVRFKTPLDLPIEDIHDGDADEVCRCICGDSDSTAKRPWIQCTDCDAWQHNDCMDISVFDDELDDHYWCQECAPERHVKLLAEMERGEQPWEVRVAKRLELKRGFESDIMTVLERLEWLWELYQPQPKAVAGNDLAVPPKRPAPASYIDAMRQGLNVLFDDLPMQSLTDLAQQLKPDDGKHRAVKLLRKYAAREYDRTDHHVLGVLSELFQWTEKGESYNESDMKQCS